MVAYRDYALSYPHRYAAIPQHPVSDPELTAAGDDAIGPSADQPPSSARAAAATAAAAPTVPRQLPADVPAFTGGVKVL